MAIIKIEHECDDGLNMQLIFEYTKGYPEERYQRNGDPGEPGQPDIIELIEVQIIGEDGQKIGQELKTWPYKWGKWMEDNYAEEVAELVREG